MSMIQTILYLHLIMYAGNCNSKWSKGLWPHTEELDKPIKVDNDCFIKISDHRYW